MFSLPCLERFTQVQKGSPQLHHLLLCTLTMTHTWTFIQRYPIIPWWETSSFWVTLMVVLKPVKCLCMGYRMMSFVSKSWILEILVYRGLMQTRMVLLQHMWGNVSILVSQRVSIFLIRYIAYQIPTDLLVSLIVTVQVWCTMPWPTYLWSPIFMIFMSPISSS